MVLHFFLRNAERLYHHPSAVGARRWSAEVRHLPSPRARQQRSPVPLA
jgi:hypothetical protein